MIKGSIAKQNGVPIHNTRPTALQADGITPLTVIGEVHLNARSHSLDPRLNALVVEELDVDILAGSPFMTHN